MGSNAKTIMAKNMICRLWIGPEESNSKSAKLSVSVKLSFTIPMLFSKVLMACSDGTIFRVAI